MTVKNFDLKDKALVKKVGIFLRCMSSLVYISSFGVMLSSLVILAGWLS